MSAPAERTRGGAHSYLQACFFEAQEVKVGSYLLDRLPRHLNHGSWKEVPEPQKNSRIPFYFCGLIRTLSTLQINNLGYNRDQIEVGPAIATSIELLPCLLN